MYINSKHKMGAFEEYSKTQKRGTIHLNPAVEESYLKNLSEERKVYPEYVNQRLTNLDHLLIKELSPT